MGTGAAAAAGIEAAERAVIGARTNVSVEKRTERRGVKSIVHE